MELSSGDMGPVADPSKVYVFDADLPVPCPVVLIHQRGSAWSQELGSSLSLLPVGSVQRILDSLYHEGVPVFELDRAEYFRRLRNLPPSHHRASRN